MSEERAQYAAVGMGLNSYERQQVWDAAVELSKHFHTPLKQHVVAAKEAYLALRGTRVCECQNQKRSLEDGEPTPVD